MQNKTNKTSSIYKIAVFNTTLPDYKIDKYSLKNASTIINAGNNWDEANKLFENLCTQYKVVVKFKNNKLAIAVNKNK